MTPSFLAIGEARNKLRWVSMTLSDDHVSASATALAAHYDNKADCLLEIFHDVQTQFGFVPDAALQPLATALNLSRAEVYGVLTFYHDFRRVPAGRHVVKLCRAESCQAMGSTALIKALEQRFHIKMGETSGDGRITLEAVYCLGLCAASPAALINGQPLARANVDKIAEALS